MSAQNSIPTEHIFQKWQNVAQLELSYIAHEDTATLDNILEVNKIDKSLDRLSKKRGNDAIVP